MRSARVALALLVFAVGAGIFMAGRGREHRSPRGIGTDLPVTMRIEEPLVQLSAVFDRGGILAEAREHPIHFGRLQPGHRLRADAGPRTALVTHPPARVRFATTAPPGAVLRFSVGVEREGKMDRSARGIRFAAHVNGREVFAQIVNPAATRHDRRWFDVRVDLGQDAARKVDVVLSTAAIGAGARLAGTPGWSHVRVVREIPQTRQPATPVKPNVLLLLVDTLRADALGCYGASPSPSPTVDRLAAGGLLFDQVVAQSPWTLPSVASIFTGMHARSHGVAGLADDEDLPEPDTDGSDPSYLPDALRTLADTAQAAGITTVGVSGNPLVGRSTNLAKGFESFVELGWSGGRSVWPRAAEINRVFLDWLSHNRKYRFLAYLHYMDVHAPYQPPKAYRPIPPPGTRKAVARGEVGRVAEMLDSPGSASPLGDADLRHLRALYDGQIRYWDDQLAALMAGLESAGVGHNTIVIVTSDHGEAFLEHGRLKHGVHLYDELLRVPLVIGGAIGRRGRMSTQAQGIDLFPTVAALLELQAPSGLRGQDVLSGSGAPWVVSETRWGLDAHGAGTELVSIRTPSWKLIHQQTRNRFELYNMIEDPTEQHDRFGHADEGTVLARQLTEWKAKAPPPPLAAGRDPEFREKLRALGYIQ
jgi:arylsulfatase A-like enzyme